MPYRPRFGLFSACFSGAAWGPGALSLARALLDSGAEAAVTMQGGVGGDAAAVFAAKFYEAMVGGAPLDLAFATARTEVINVAGLTTPDWALPRLNLRVPPDGLLPAGWGLSPAVAKRLEQDVDSARRNGFSYYSRTLTHVDRREHRRQLIAHLERMRQVQPGPPEPLRLLLITGPHDAGKTDLGVCCLACGLALGYRPVYVDLSRRGPLDCHAVLCRIRDVGQEVPMMYPLPAASFGAFSSLPAPSPSQRGDEHAVRDLAEAFLDGLAGVAAAAPTEPLILALDQFTGPKGAGVVPGEFEALLVPHLLQPLARGDIPNVFPLLIVTDDEHERLGLANLPVRHRCRIEPFPAQKFSELAEEYCLYRGYLRRNRKATNLILQGLAELEPFNDRWNPGDMRDVLDQSFRRSQT
jgi:hypothetical protein